MTDPRIQHMIDRYFPQGTHPYARLRERVNDHVTLSSTVLEIGCGRSATMLRELKGRAGRLIGVEVVDFTIEDPEITLLSHDVAQMPGVETGSVDLAFSRSVMEHLEDPAGAFAEIARVLAPGGCYVFLTPNFWDYASLIAAAVPNSLHPRIVRFAEGRAEEDTFPTYFRANTRRSIARLAGDAGLEVSEFSYHGQYPNYFTFSPFLFRIGCLYARFLARHRWLHALQGWIFCEVQKPGG